MIRSLADATVVSKRCAARVLMLLATGGFCTSEHVIAHHGFGAHYDVNDYISIEGVVTRFEFVNPHAFVHIEVTDETGRTLVHWCEMQSATQLRRKGITEASFGVGDRVRVEGFQARRDPLGCEFALGELADGSVLMLRDPEGRSQYVARVLSHDPSVLGTWHRKSFPGAGTNPPAGENLTVTGQAALESYDNLADYPALMCDPVSPIQSWQQPGLPTNVRREGDTIVIHHEFMDVERTVHLDVSASPDDVERSPMGHSVGRFDGDDLLIDTTGFSAGNITGGLLHSDEFELHERLSVNPETGDLEIVWTATDPAHYTQTLEGSRIMVRTDMAVDRYECVPELGHAPNRE